MKAITVMTVQADAYSGHARKELHVGAKYAEQAAISKVTDLLHKYIKTNEVDHVMYIDRYFYFDTESFNADLEKFGVEVPPTQIVPVGAKERT